MEWLLNRKPWAVQVEALKRAAGKKRYAWHVEQGMGKSSVALNDFLNSDADVMIVVAPQAFKPDWTIIPAEWGSNLPAGMWPRDPFPTGKTKCLYVLNYEAIRTSAGKRVAQLMRQKRVFFVLDESTAIKNPRSQTTRAVLDLSKDAYMVRILNGTPLVNNCLDLFGPLKCLDQLDGMNPFQFRNRFAVLGGFMGKQIKGLKNEAELYKILDACAFRALKSDWRADLPPKVYSTVRLEMTAKQRRHYHEMLEEFLTVIDEREVSADMVLIQIGKLQQIASCLSIQDGHTEAFEEPKNNPKLRATLDILEGGPSKAIVIYFFKGSGALLLSELTRAGYNPARIQGGMKPEEVLAEKDKFNNDPTCRVLVGQESATARGHTLIGNKQAGWASRMVYFENSFSLMERLQSEDRIHRGDQPEPCTYYDLVTSPIDEKVIEALRNKKALADQVDSFVKVVRSIRV